MVTGLDFLRAQIGNAVAQHSSLVRMVTDHETASDDQRFRDLCGRHLPRLREHQRMLERFRDKIAANPQDANDTLVGNVTDTVKKAAGQAFAMARDLADVARPDDFVRLTGDIVLGRQSEDIFKTFREAGRALPIPELARIGEVGEAGMDAFVKDANRLIQQMFAERAKGAEHSIQLRAGVQPELGF